LQLLCVCFCPLTYLKKPHVQTSRSFLYILPMAMARSCCDDSAIHYVLPVLCMTPHFHITGHMQVRTRSLQNNELFTVTYQVALLNCIPRRTKSSITDCPVLSIGLCMDPFQAACNTQQFSRHFAGVPLILNLLMCRHKELWG